MSSLATSQEIFNTLRHRTGLTQREFAERVGYSQTFIARIEAGKIKASPAFLAEVRRVFGDERYDTDLRSIGERIASERRKQRISQAELADKVGCTRTQISLIESGKSGTSSNTLQKIAETLGLNPDWLRTGQGESGREDFSRVYELLKKDMNTQTEVYAWLTKRFKEKEAQPKEEPI